MTTRPRTICDLAGHLTRDELELVLDRALARRLVSRASIVASLGRLPRNAKGLGALRALLDARPEGRARVESPLEQELQRLLRRARVRGWTPQHQVCGRRIDVAFVAERLALEVDSYLRHSSHSDWAMDHKRQVVLIEAGWRVLPVTAQDLREPMRSSRASRRSGAPRR